MVSKLACGALVGLMFAAIATSIATGAQASEATTVAGRAGFLIGHAQRCGVAEDRLQGSAERLNQVIAAFAADDEDRDAAQARFAASIAAAALAQLLGDKLPSCAMVRSTLAQFERHRQPVKQRQGQMARNDHRDGMARHAVRTGTIPGKSARRTSIRRDEPSAERRAAQQTSGKPPSI